MENKGIEWSQLFASRDKIHSRFRDVWDIPIIKKRSHLLRRILKDDMSVLDVGAGMRGMKDEIAGINTSVGYKSMDIDRRNNHDFYDIGEIHEQFDIITLFEVIEHVSLEEGLALLKRLKEITKENGLIVVSTPNIFNPARYMRDATHKTFFGYDELCGLMNMAGFEIKDVYRSFNAALHRYILKVYLFHFLFRFFSIDYANSIFVVAENRR